MIYHLINMKPSNNNPLSSDNFSTKPKKKLLLWLKLGVIFASFFVLKTSSFFICVNKLSESSGADIILCVPLSIPMILALGWIIEYFTSVIDLPIILQGIILFLGSVIWFAVGALIALLINRFKKKKIILSQIPKEIQREIQNKFNILSIISFVAAIIKVLLDIFDFINFKFELFKISIPSISFLVILILSIIALIQIKKYPQRGRGLAIAALVISLSFNALFYIILIILL